MARHMARLYRLIFLWMTVCIVWAPPASAQFDPLAKLGLPLFQEQLLPADEAFHFSAEVADPETLRLDWQIADGYYLYRKQFKIKSLTPGISLARLQLPPGKTKQDPEYGTTEVYYHQVSATTTIDRPATATSLTLEVRYQGCADRGVCYPPILKTLTLNLPSLSNVTSDTTSADTFLLTEQDEIAQALKKQGFWLTILSFLGFGILLAFTPCCFPMLPILSGIIVGHGHSITTAKAFGLSLSYVLMSALTYTLFGILAGVFGANLQVAFQNPWIISIFSALFVALALSMFGLYELQMPSSWQSKLANLRGGKQGGSFINAGVLGALSALIVGPCVAAPLAGALIYIGQTGDAVLGGAALFALGMGMGLPLIVVGTSAGKMLPRAGLWMNTVKSVFGVLLLGVAIWLLERILPPAATMFLWAVWLIVPAIYLGAGSPLSEEASHSRKLGKALGIVMLSYGILLLIGVAAGSRDVLRPLHVLTARSGISESTEFQRIASIGELERHLQSGNRWVMLDFYADWCISCKELEHNTFTDPKVRQALSSMATLKADVTANAESDQELLQKFNLIGPPAVLFFDPQGNECRSARLIGFVPPEQFLAHLQQLQQRCG